MSDRSVRLSSSLQCSSSLQVSSSRLTAYDLQLRKVISPSFELRFGCSWTLWKAHGIKNTLICLRRMLDVRLSSSLQCSSSLQVSSSRLTTHDLQLRKVISPSFELRFGCSWTLWKAHGVKNTLIFLRRMLDVRPKF